MCLFTDEYCPVLLLMHISACLALLTVTKGFWGLHVTHLFYIQYIYIEMNLNLKFKFIIYKGNVCFYWHMCRRSHKGAINLDTPFQNPGKNLDWSLEIYQISTMAIGL